LFYYEAAAKETKALLNPKVATKNGIPYTKYPIIALFLIAGPSKKEYLKEVRKQIRKNPLPTQPKMVNFDYAKMEKDMIEKQDISEDNPYGMEEEEEDDWGDSDYWGEEDYKYEQGFYQNTTNEDSKIWLKAAHNIGITIDLREDATNYKDEPIPDYLAIYIPDEDERARAKELSDEFNKVQKAYEISKPSNPSTYTFAVPLPIDFEELNKRLTGSVKVPIISMETTPTIQAATQLRIVFRNPINDINKRLMSLIIDSAHKETKEKNPDPILDSPPKKKEKLYTMDNTAVSPLKGIMTQEEIEEAQVNFEKVSKLSESKPIASKAKTLKKMINDKLLEVNKNNDIIDWDFLNKEMAKGVAVPKNLLQDLNYKEGDFERILTVTAEDAALYEHAAKHLKLPIRARQTQSFVGTTNKLFDIFVLKDQMLRVSDLIEIVNKLKTEKMADPTLKPTPPLYMGVDWAKGGEPKKKKKRNYGPGQRKVKFKKD